MCPHMCQVSEERAGGQQVGCPLPQQEGLPRAASACVLWNLQSEKSEATTSPSWLRQGTRPL